MAREHFRDKMSLQKRPVLYINFVICVYQRKRQVTHMKKGLTELVFILDRSGSMGGLESDTIGGFNGMLGKQKKEEGEANVTTVLFDDQIEIVHDRFPIDVVKPLTDDDYFVRGSTALLDTVGSTVKKWKTFRNACRKKCEQRILFLLSPRMDRKMPVKNILRVW